MANDDGGLNFENDKSVGGGSSVACKSSQSSQSSTSSSLVSGNYRTKSQRRKMRLSQQSDPEEKTVRFSLSPGRDSLDSVFTSSTTMSRRRHRRKIHGSGDDQRSLDPTSSRGSPSRASSSSLQQSQSPQRYSQDSLQSQSSQKSSPRSARGSPSRRSLLLRLSQDSSLSSSSRVSFSLSPHEEVDVRGAGIDVLAVQDAGSYRMLFDDAAYLCSTILSTNPASALDAACDLALLLSDCKTRSILLSEKDGGAALAAILETLSAVTEPTAIELDGILGVVKTTGEEYNVYCGGSMLSPNGKMIPSTNRTCKPQTKTARKQALEKQPVMEHPRNHHLLHEALAAVIHFLSWDCTTAQHSSSSNASRARQVRSAILEHPIALQSACHLALIDSVVEDMLSKVEKIESGSVKSVSSVPRRVGGEHGQYDIDDDDASRASSVNTRDSLSSSHSDLAAAGRKKRRRKRRIQVGQKKAKLDVIVEDQEFAFTDSPVKPPAQVNMHMSFMSEDESIGSQKQQRVDDDSVSSATSVQVSEKLVQVRAAIIQPEADNQDCKAKVAQHTCELAANGLGESRETNLLKRGDFVLTSICRIVEGKEGEEDSCIENVADAGRGDVERSSQDPLGEQDEEDEEEQLRQNPLLFTNTLLRKGGTLPALCRAMSETLSAVIVGLLTNGSSCTECISHLKQRVAVLAALVDGACCLTSENRQELCGNGSQLLSSILLFLKTFSDTECRSPFEGTLLDEIALLTLRTLTSLTHDNAVARELLVMSYKVNATTFSVPLPGVLILANLLWKTVSKSEASQLHSSYDVIIFCLNTLSNAVEAKNLRRMLADFKVPVISGANGDSAASTKEELFLTWLSRWLFLETTTFRDAVMRSTFGQKTKQGTSHEMRDLEKDDEEHLITAGNGFIFIACLMRQSKILFDVDEQLFVNIREVVLKELQVDDKGNGLLLIKNTLRAFCNFYHYSLGDFSVAIVAPVGRLIAELDRMEVAVQGNSTEEQPLFT